MEEATSQHQQHPWLLFYHGNRYQQQSQIQSLYHLPSELVTPSAAYTTTSQLQGKTVQNSCHGWLVLLSESKPAVYSLWNPVTFESIELPPIQLNDEECVDLCLLSAPPRHPSSMLILFEKTTPSLFVYRLCLDVEAGVGVEEDQSWSQIPYANQLKRVIRDRDYYNLHQPAFLWPDHEQGEDKDKNRYIFSHVASCNGKLYGVTSARNIVVHIEIVDHDEYHYANMRSLKCDNTRPRFRQSFSYDYKDYYVESDGQLFNIFITFGGLKDEQVLEVQVWKLDFSSTTNHLEWEEVESIDDRIFFIGCHYATSCTATESGREGGYIHLVRSNDNSLYSYNFRDKSLSLTFPCPNLPTPWKTPVWVIGSLTHGKDEDKNIQNGCTYNVIREIEKLNMQEEEISEEARAAGQLLLVDLPQDILQSIASHFVLFDYMNFRATCKTVHSAAPPIHWRSIASTTGKLKLNSPRPLLMLPPQAQEDKEGCSVSTLIDPKHGSRYFISIPQLEVGSLDATICSSMYGWLLITSCTPEVNYNMIFYNPFTKSTIQIPNLTDEFFVIKAFGFSNPPTSSTCSVVGITHDSYQDDWYSIVTVFTTFVGSPSWTTHQFINNLPFEPNHNSPIMYEGAYYFLGQKGNLAILSEVEGQGEGDDLEFNWKVLKKPHPPCKFFHENYLLKCGDDLLSLFVGKFGKWVKVFKLSNDKRNWEKVENLGKYMLYVSGATSFAVEATQPGMENKIYFPRLYGDDVLFYSLHTCKFHTFGSNDCSLPNYYNTREQLLCGWIEPTFSTGS